jgi:hypothetical protein
LYYIQQNDVLFLFDPQVTPFPSAFMPPGYVCFLLPFMMIKNIPLGNFFIVFTQTVISLLTIIFIYQFTIKYFSKRTALISALLASIYPDIAYSVVSFTPTVLFHAAVIATIIFMYKFDEMHSKKIIVQISLLFVFLSYLRSEFLLFVFLFITLLLFSRRWKYAGIIFVVTVSLLAPWTIRNSSVFHQFVPFSTGFGLNLYRGNNPEGLGNWCDDDLKNEIRHLPKDRSLETNLDHLYRQRAISFIQLHPWQEISTLPVKLYHLWIYSSLEERSYSALYQIVSVCFFILSIIGLIKTASWHHHKYLYLFILYSTIIALLFFTLPRYQTMMRIGLLPFTGAGLDNLWTFCMQWMKNIKVNGNN